MLIVYVQFVSKVQEAELWIILLLRRDDNFHLRALLADECSCLLNNGVHLHCRWLKNGLTTLNDVFEKHGYDKYKSQPK